MTSHQSSFLLIIIMIICVFSVVVTQQLTISADGKNSSCNVNFLIKKNGTLLDENDLPIFNYAVLETAAGILESSSSSKFLLNENLLKQSSILYGIISTATKEDLNYKCFNQMKAIRNGIHDRNIWAIKVLDASGTHESGFLWGHNFWLGSRKGCESVNQPPTITLNTKFPRIMKENLIKDVAQFDVEFRVIHGRHYSPWQVEIKFLGEGILHYGICVPKSCTNEEIKNITEKYFETRNLYVQNLFEFNPKIIQVKDLNLRDDFFNKFTVKLFVIVMIITCILIFIGLYNDSKNIDNTNNNNCDDIYVNANIQQEQRLNEKLLLTDNNLIQSEERLKEINQLVIIEATTFEKIIKCFSIKDNFNWLMKVDTTPASIPVINGLRSIACIWILSFHVNWFAHFTIDNESILFAYAEKVYFLYLSNSAILVDLFFTISGLLLSYNFLKNTKKIEEIKTNCFKDNLKLFGRNLLQRYVRLSALNLIVLVIAEILTTYLADVSQFYLHERNDLLCKNYWWRNIFYIQNLFHADDLCINWTWSLACEMQFFVIFTIILYIYAKNPSLGIKLFFGFSIGVFFLSMGLAFFLEFSPTFDVLYETGTLLYIAPWGRIHPYYAGVFFGWYLFTYKDRKPLTKKQIRLYWVIATTIIITCLHATVKRDLPVVVATLLLSFGRVLFGSSMAWMIVSSATGNGNWFTRFLEWKPFVHFNKVSYAMYLLNPITITTIYGLMDSSSHTDPLITGLMTVAMIVIVYGISVLSSLLFEIPYNKLLDEFLRPQIKKKIK